MTKSKSNVSSKATIVKSNKTASVFVQKSKEKEVNPLRVKTTKKMTDSVKKNSDIAKILDKLSTVSVATTVYKTTDYDLFVYIKGNRNIYKNVIAKLRKSIEKENLLHLQPVLVNVVLRNGKVLFELIDGQHRFTLSKSRNEPIYFIAACGLGITHVQILNSTSTNWKTDNYVDSYMTTNNEEYKKYNEFKKRHGLGHNSALVILSGKNYVNATKKEFDNFREGSFKIADMEKAEKLATYVNDFKDLYPGYKRKMFISTISRLMDNPEYSNEIMVAKLRLQPKYTLQNYMSVREYLIAFENIYNYMNRNKVRFV